MARRDNRSDFDDFDDFDDYSGSENKYTSGSGYTETSREEEDDWADGSRRNTGRKSTGRGSRSRGGNRKLLFAVPLALVLIGAVIAIALGGSDEPVQVQNPQATSAVSGDDQNLPDTPQVTLPPVTQPPATQPQQDPLPTEPPATQPPVSEPVRFGYYGRLLSAEHQSVYEQIYRGIRDYDAETDVVLKNYEDIYAIVSAVQDDHPELFWFRGAYSTSYVTMVDHVDITVIYTYEYPEEEGLQYKAFVENATRDILQQLEGKSEYEKVKGVYDYLIDNTIYDLAYKGSTIYKMFSENRAVCEGYARATQYLLQNLGVEAIYVSGEAGSPGNAEGHAWNIVNVEGDYYQLDTTWGDPVSDDGSQSKNYNYFLVTDEEMARDHYPERYDLPECVATSCNYYHRESNFLVSYDKQTLAAWLTGAANRLEPLEFKCADRQVYQQTMKNLFENDEIWEIMESALGATYSVSYSYNDTLYTITITVEW